MKPVTALAAMAIMLCIQGLSSAIPPGPPIVTNPVVSTSGAISYTGTSRLSGYRVVSENFNGDLIDTSSGTATAIDFSMYYPNGKVLINQRGITTFPSGVAVVYPNYNPFINGYPQVTVMNAKEGCAFGDYFSIPSPIIPLPVSNHILTEYGSTSALDPPSYYILSLPGAGADAISGYFAGSGKSPGNDFVDITAYANSAGTGGVIGSLSIMDSNGWNPISFSSANGTLIKAIKVSYHSTAAIPDAGNQTIDGFEFSQAPTWSGSGGTNCWSPASSWVNGVLPKAGNTATFPDLEIPKECVSISRTQTVGSLDFTASSTQYSLSGTGSITLDSNSSSPSLVFKPNFGIISPMGSGIKPLGDGSHPVRITFTGSATSISVPINLKNDLLVTVAPNSELKISGQIIGLGNRLTETGGGTLILSGTAGNEWTDGTYVDMGTMIATNVNAMPADGLLTVGGAGIFVFDPSALSGGATQPATQTEAVPEPDSILLAISGLAVLYLLRLRHKRRSNRDS